MNMRVELINGRRPTWLKDTDHVIGRYYDDGNYNTIPVALGTGRSVNNPTGPGCTFTYSPNLAAIEIEDTHPYAVATSRGFTYHDGGTKPTGDVAEVLFRNGHIPKNDRAFRWDHHLVPFDIIGYRLAEPTTKYLVETNIKFEVNATTLTDAHEMAEALLEDSSLVGSWTPPAVHPAVTHADGNAYFHDQPEIIPVRATLTDGKITAVELRQP